MSEIKVGDKIKVNELMFSDKQYGIVKGETYEVTELSSEGDGVFVNTYKRNKVGLIHEQIEKVEEDGQVSGFKVGDKVKVISLKSWKDERYLQIGKTYTVDRVDADGWPLIVTDGVLHNMMPSQVEKVENKTEFTFPQMAQKLIDGEFEIGTELIADGKSYFVDRVFHSRNYGLKTNKEGGSVNSNIGASSFNATWKVKEQPVKEQPIKEMSIEEIQKELGYKIKVTE